MSIQSLARSGVLAPLVLLPLTLACGDDNEGPTGPDPTGNVEVTLAISGEALDADGCVFTVDAAGARRLTAGESTTYTGLSVGQHEVAISDVAGNCQVLGDVVRNVSVAADQTATAAFTVTCSSTSGSMAVSAFTSGEDLDEDGYEIVVDGGAPSAIGLDGTVTAGGLSPGDHTVQLEGEAFNCFVAGDNPRTVSVRAGAETPVTFDVTCRYHLYDRIVFSSNRSGDGMLYAVDPHTRSPARSLGLPAWNPAVSPDGLSIAIGYAGVVWLANSDGSDLRQLTDGPQWSGVPAWSPDGSKIAFVREVATLQEIWTMDADGSNPQSLGAQGQEPTWSPDGTKIAFMNWFGGNREVFVMNANGSGLYNLTNHPADDQKPAWSPLGNLISFQSDRDGSPHIFVVDPAGGPVTNMTIALVGSARHPAWAPMAVAGAFESYESGNSDIYYFDPNVPELVQLTTDPGTDYSPSWGGGN